MMLGTNMAVILAFVITVANVIFLSVTGVDTIEPAIKTVEMDVNDFLEYAKPKEVSEREILSYTTSYASAEVLYQETGIKLPQYEGDTKNIYDDLSF